ncbi:MAG: radical SAM protein [Spirulina sp. SIO3F2]|nr:radical SAM protein [Spirulina sp. SIO3F2]
MSPKVTAEVFHIPIDDENYLIYAPLRKAAFLGNAHTVNFLVDLFEGNQRGYDFEEHKLIEFLEHLEILNSQEEEKKPITQFKGNFRPTGVTLFLTTACNLRCTYCYASAGDTPLKSMSLDTAKRGIDFIVKNAIEQNKPSFRLSYHGGGEPTTNWQVLVKSFEYAKRKAEQSKMLLHASSATNGFLSDQQIHWIASHLDGVSLSFDGLPQIHDKHRVTKQGEKSSHHIIKTIRSFDQLKFNYNIRMTVTHDQIAFLPDSVEFICANFNPQRIQVEPAYQLGRWHDAPSAETTDFIEAYREAQFRAKRYDREISYSAARLDLLTNHFCGVSQDSFSLSATGEVSGCYEVFSTDSPYANIFFYGKPRDQKTGYEFDLKTLDNLRNKGVENRDFCKSCFAKWHCAGDCYHKSLVVNGEEEFSGSERCHITRELIKDQLLNRISEAGGLYWHEPPKIKS